METHILDTYMLHHCCILLRLNCEDFYRNTEYYVLTPTRLNNSGFPMSAHTYSAEDVLTLIVKRTVTPQNQTSLIASYAHTTINAISSPFENFKAAWNSLN